MKSRQVACSGAASSGDELGLLSSLLPGEGALALQPFMSIFPLLDSPGLGPLPTEQQFLVSAVLWNPPLCWMRVDEGMGAQRG